MAVGMALSQLTEPPGKAMRFDHEEMESDEAVWYMSLVRVKDTVGSLESIASKTKTTKSLPKSRNGAESASTSRPRGRNNPQSVKIVSIEEMDSEEGEEDDLIPYEKPDADPSDSEDDPTLIQRGKPTAPV